MLGETSEKSFLQKLEALAFCRSNDAVKLAYLKDGQLSRIDDLDLAALTEFHHLSNGTVELKFIDRIKLMELLLRLTAVSSDGGASELMAAIRASADRLRSEEGDGDAL